MSYVLWSGLALVGLMLVVYLVVNLTRRGETAAPPAPMATEAPVPRPGNQVHPGGDRSPLDHLDPAPAAPAPTRPGPPRPAPVHDVRPPSPRLPPSARPEPQIPAEPEDRRPLRAPGSRRTPGASPPGPPPQARPAPRPAPGGPPAPGRTPAAAGPPGSAGRADPKRPGAPPPSAAAEPLVRARLGSRDDTWRPTPREASDDDREDAADRFGSTRAVPKYVPGIDQLRSPAPGPGDDTADPGPPPAARATPAAPGPDPRRPNPPRPSRPPARPESVIDFTGSRRGPAPRGPGRPVKGRPLTPPPGRRPGGHPIAPPAAAAAAAASTAEVAGSAPGDAGTAAPTTPPAAEVVEPETVSAPVGVGAEATVEPAPEAEAEAKMEVEPEAGIEITGDDEVIDLRDEVPVAPVGAEPEVVVPAAGAAPESGADDVVIDLRDDVPVVPAAAAEPEAEPVADEVVIDLRDDAVAVPAPPRVEFEPEDDQVDQILQALVRRARERRVAIADVAVELVEQAELEDRDIDDVLADLVENSPGDGEELVLYNRSVPSRPGRLVDLDSLGVEEKKRIIVRVLCLLVALQEESNAETAASRTAVDPDAPTDAGTEGETGDGGDAGTSDGAAAEAAPAGPGEGEWASTESAWPVPLNDPESGTGGDDDLPDRRLLRGWHT